MVEKQLALIWYEEITSLPPYVLPLICCAHRWSSHVSKTLQNSATHTGGLLPKHCTNDI